MFHRSKRSNLQWYWHKTEAESSRKWGFVTISFSSYSLGTSAECSGFYVCRYWKAQTFDLKMMCLFWKWCKIFLTGKVCIFLWWDYRQGPCLADSIWVGKPCFHFSGCVNALIMLCYSHFSHTWHLWCVEKFLFLLDCL